MAKLTPKQIAKFKQLMVERIAQSYRETRSDVRDLTAPAHEIVREEDDSPRDEGDDAVRTQLADLRVSLDEREAHLAQLMEAALRRMAEGTYGQCVECGQTIELDRLKAMPWAERCIDDQEALEQKEQQHPPTL